MQCLQLTRGEPPAITTPVAVTITGEGDADRRYATINGTKQYSAGTHEVNAGDTITFCIFGMLGMGGTPGSLTIDGTQVLGATGGIMETYDWTVPNDISTVEIAMSYVDSMTAPAYGTITVTTA